MMTGPLGSDFLRHILAELREQTDRGVVIIGGSYVENSLEHFLKEAWRKETDGANEKKALSEAFNPSGPLVAVQSVKPALRRLAFSDKAAAWMPLSNSDKLSATAAST
jgi:hypothetical protein